MTIGFYDYTQGNNTAGHICNWSDVSFLPRIGETVMLNKNNYLIVKVMDVCWISSNRAAVLVKNMEL